MKDKFYQELEESGLEETFNAMNDRSSPLCSPLGPLDKLPTISNLGIAHESWMIAMSYLMKDDMDKKGIESFDAAVLRAVAALLSCLRPQDVQG